MFFWVPDCARHYGQKAEDTALRQTLDPAPIEIIF